jgi:nitroreductase
VISGNLDGDAVQPTRRADDMDEPKGALGLTRRQTEQVLATAGSAPSLHNSQPWRFRPDPHSITLIADRERRLPVTDPDDRELRIACGAALFGLRLALHGQGIRPLVTVLPDRSDPDLIAVVRHGGLRSAPPELTRLLDAVPRRRTNRQPFSDVPVDAPEQYALRRAAQDEGTWLHLVTDRREREHLRELAAAAHRRQIADPGFRAELARWSAAEPGRADGVPASAGGPLPEPGTGWAHRDFTGGAAQPLPSWKPAEDEPLVAVLTSHLSGPPAEVQVGQALQRVLLTATAEGLAVSFLSQVVEVAETREALRRLIHATRPPQVVLRIGRGWPVGATPRRQVADMLAAPSAESRDRAPWPTPR